MANKSLLTAGLSTREQFLRKVSEHIADYHRLETALDAPGTHKGPPLYGGGALSALCLDVLIRKASGGDRTLDDVFATLWRVTDHGARPYDWNAIRDALEATASGDWAGFHRRYVAGREPLPIDAALHDLGLRLIDAGAGQPPQVAQDPMASAQARARWQAFVGR